MPSSDQGVNLERYMLVPRTLILITRGDSILLLKGSQNKRLWPGLYNGVGGHVEQGEDIYSAAKREVLEETGVSINDLFLCGVITVDTNINPGVCVFVFKGEYRQGEIKSSGEGSVEWIPLKDITNISLVPDLPLILSRIIPFQDETKIFFAQSTYNDEGNLIVNFS